MCRNEANRYSFGNRKLVFGPALFAPLWARIKTLRPLDPSFKFDTHG